MNLSRTAITALLFLLIPAFLYAQPANDDCSNSVLLTSSTSCVNTGGTIVNATYNPSTFTAGCGATNKVDVWYRFVAVAPTQTITVSSGPSQIRVELFSGSCGSLTSLSCGNTSITNTSLTIGVTYYIRVYTQNNNTGSFNICVTHTPPANDDCAGATSLTSNTSCVNTAGTLNLATANVATALGCFAAGTYYDVWYSFVAEATSETVTISGLGANITNPRIQIYTSGCAALGSPVCGNTTITQTGLTIGTIYKIRVANLNASPSGAGTVANFNICVTHTPPANDDCAGAISLTSGTSCVNTGGTLVGASYTTISSIGCGTASRNDVWYSFVAASANTTITLSSAPANPRIQLFSGSCASLTSVACASGTSLASTTLTPGTTYYVRIYTDPNTTSASNTFNICVTHTGPTNDDCGGAISLTSNTGCITTTGSLNLATPSASIGVGCGAAGTYYDVWYSFVAVAASQTVTISNLGASITASRLQIYTSACAALGAPICGNTTITQTGLTIGTTYKIRVSNFNADPSGNGTASSFDLCVTHAGLANDLCGAATLLTSGSSCVNTPGTLVGATYTAITDCSGYTDVDVWYKFVAQSPNPTITLSGSSSNRVRTQLFSGSCGSLTCITGNTGNATTQTINATCLTVGNTYYVRVTTSTGATPTYNICVTDPAANSAPANDNCSGATTLTPVTSCGSTAGTLAGATVSSPSVSSACTGTPGADVWYKFTATSAFPTITLSGVGTSICGTYIQLFAGSCGSFTEISCVNGTSLSPGGTGLTVGNTYYIRIYSPSTLTPGTGWGFNICVLNPGTGSTATIDYSKSYINVTKLTTGGSVEPGDILEIRATFVVRSGTVDSLAFYDTLNSNSGFTLLSTSIAERTNEGKIYRRDSPTKAEYTDAAGDDAGWYTPLAGGDTAIQINIGIGANASARGRLVNSSRPSVYGSTCIIMATYRVQVYAGYNSTINWGGGVFTYKDGSNMKMVTLKNDYLTVYVSPGLCSSSLSTVNKVGIETDGTFDAPLVPSSGNRNRGTSTAVPSYTYAAFGTGTGPNDYYYGIANNTSATYTTLNTYPKSTSGSTIPQRLFSHWDITGDHTGASNTAQGNPPCDYNLPVSATNPCGYMLVVNAAYKTDTAFKSTITNLCPNTYYEISAWIKNICYKCGCDSNGVAAASGSSSYIPLTTNDSSGVQPNLAFQINGQDYYTTGNMVYTGTGAGITQTASDGMNTWVKRGFVYKTGTSETGFEFLIRNNAPGGGGNDWAIDDIGVSTCLPNMAYSPSLSPTICDSNTLAVNDTIRSSYENYTSYKWQRSTNGGSSWTDVTTALGPATPTWTGTAWQYVATYNIPPANTNAADSGDMYRMIVATTASNLGNTNCQFSEALNIITLDIIDCNLPLTTNLLSFNGKLVNDHAQLFWTTSKEDELINFDIEKSDDGINFIKIGNLNGYNDIRSEVNHYSFIDPARFNGKSWYRIAMKNKKAGKKYSGIIQLNNEQIDFGLGNIINPFSNELKFEINTTENTKIDVSLYDLFGKAVKNKNYMVYAGVNGISLENTGKLSPGIYILQVKNKDIIINSKVMKK